MKRRRRLLLFLLHARTHPEILPNPTVYPPPPPPPLQKTTGGSPLANTFHVSNPPSPFPPQPFPRKRKRVSVRLRASVTLFPPPNFLPPPSDPPTLASSFSDPSHAPPPSSFHPHSFTLTLTLTHHFSFGVYILLPSYPPPPSQLPSTPLSPLSSFLPVFLSLSHSLSFFINNNTTFSLPLYFQQKKNAKQKKTKQQ